MTTKVLAEKTFKYFAEEYQAEIIEFEPGIDGAKKYAIKVKFIDFVTYNRKYGSQEKVATGINFPEFDSFYEAYGYLLMKVEKSVLAHFEISAFIHELPPSQY